MERAERALGAMLKEAGVEVRLGEPLDRLEVAEGRVLSLATPQGTYRAPYVVDATDTAERACLVNRLVPRGRRKK